MGTVHIVQVNQIQNIHFETDMTAEIDMKWFFFQTGIRSTFCDGGFFFLSKKKWLNPMTNINDDYFLWHTVFDEDD